MKRREITEVTYGQLIDSALSAVKQMKNGLHRKKKVKMIELSNNNTTIKFTFTDNSWATAQMGGLFNDKS